MKTFIYSRLWLRKTVGVSLIILGVFGLILPIIPGIIPLVIGLELAGIRLAFFDRFFPGRALATDVPSEASASV